MKTAVYLYSPDDKDVDFDLLMSALTERIAISIDDVYADGWVSIPNGLGELLNDLSRFQQVILLTLEGITKEDLKKMVEGAEVLCLLSGYGWAKSTKDVNFRALCVLIDGEDYYRQLRSLKIKSGMKKTDKHVGNIPFGHERKEDGTLAEIPEMMAVAKRVKDQYIAGVPVASIATNSKILTVRQVYGLMEYWGVKRG